MAAIAYLSQSETASEMLNTIIQSDKIVKTNIVNITENSFNENGTINWNPNINSGGISRDPVSGGYTNQRPPAVGLAHELAHSEDWIISGKLNSDTYSYGIYNNKKISLSYAELYACNKENMIRSELFVPKRVFYSYSRTTLPKKYNNFQLLIPHQHSYLQNSLFYKPIVSNP